MFGHGYPAQYVAYVLGVDRKTIFSWKAKLGLASRADGRNNRRINRMVRSVQLMSREDREVLFSMLSRKGFL